MGAYRSGNLAGRLRISRISVKHPILVLAFSAAAMAQIYPPVGYPGQYQPPPPQAPPPSGIQAQPLPPPPGAVAAPPPPQRARTTPQPGSPPGPPSANPATPAPPQPADTTPPPPPDDTIVTAQCFPPYGSERYSISSNAWKNEGPLPVSIIDHVMSEIGPALLMYNGKVLFVAGSGNDPDEFAAGTFESAVYDPVTGKFQGIPTPDDFFCAGHVQLAEAHVQGAAQEGTIHAKAHGRPRHHRTTQRDFLDRLRIIAAGA